MVAPFSKFYGKIWVGFCLNTGKRFFRGFHFKANRRSIAYSKKQDYNLGQNKSCRLFYFLAQFLFTTSETKLDHHPQKVIVWKWMNECMSELPHDLPNDLRLGS